MKFTLETTHNLELKVQLTVSSGKGKRHTDLNSSLSSSLGKEVCCCTQSSHDRETSESLKTSQRRGLRERIHTIISALACRSSRKKDKQTRLYETSEIDPTIAGQEIKYRRVSELTGSGFPISLKIPAKTSFSVAQKLEYTLCEMSPENQLPVEIYSLEPSSTSDNGNEWYQSDRYQSDRKEVSNYDFQRCNNVMVPGTSIAEMPGDYFHFVAPDADEGHVTHIEWPSERIELPHECYNTEHYPQVITDSDVPIQDADPGLLSPQIASHKSSPVSPETPAAPEGPLSHNNGFATGPTQSQEANLLQCLVDSVALDSAVDLLISSFEGDFDSSDQAFLRDVAKEDDTIDHLDWSGPPHALFQPSPQQVEDYQTYHLTLDAASLVSHSILGEGPESNVPRTQPVLNRAMTSPSRLPDSKKLSLQELRAREGTWQLDDSNNWIACNPMVPHQSNDGAGNSLQNHAPAVSNLGENAPALGKTYHPVKCNHCDNMYTGQYAQNNMRRHSILKHGNGCVKVYRCSVCNKRYLRSDARKTHESLKH